jgi:pheromone shutdown protein TraB
MKRRRRQSASSYLFYNETTEPVLPTITTPMPRMAIPRESWIQRVSRGLGTFFSTIINKANQLLALALATLLLLLFTRFILFFFHFYSIGGALSFSHWIFLLSAPLVVPFQNLLPILPYNSYTIEVSTLIAILVYAIGITIIRQFLKVLAAR